MKPFALLLAGILLLLVAVPLGAAVLVTVIAAPAVAEQLRQDPCSYLTATESTALATSPGTNSTAGTSVGLPQVGTPRRASLRNLPLPIPAGIKTLYLAAASRYRVPWALLAGVGMEETAHGRNTGTSSAGARGLMQFMPGTWKTYGTDGNDDGRATITNDADSIVSAARFLAATGARTTAGIRKALYAYNHANWYVNDVLFYAHRYATSSAGESGAPATESAACDPASDPGGEDPGPAPGEPGGSCPPSGSAAERGLAATTLRALRCTKQAFPWIRSMGGVGSRPNKSDHPGGHAVDYMIPAWNTTAGRARGWQLAHWLQANAARLRVKYVIFNGKVWRAYRASQGWTTYSFPGPRPWTATQLHRDHVHSSHY